MYDVDLTSVRGFLASLWKLSGGALRLDPDAFVTAAAKDRGTVLALCILFLAGMSYMAGQSIVLLANRISPRHFVIRLTAGAGHFIVDIVFWASSSWLIGVLLLGARPHPP